MAKRRTIEWPEADKIQSGLETDIKHELCVKREAIPIVFVPGIMGTCLRRPGTDGAGEADGLPNLRWNPSSFGWMWSNMHGKSGAERKLMLVGPQKFDPGFLEPNNATPPGDGFRALFDPYVKDFLNLLRAHDWGQMTKIFVFPVYAFGYNWTGSAEDAGKKLATRIGEIIAEAKEITGLCEKVIVISHSMGGLVTRWAREKTGAGGSMLGVIHGVQPTTGATAAYWRMKAGFEGGGFMNWVMSGFLGPSGREVTPVLGNIPGGLQLLPNKQHRTNGGYMGWLTITEDGEIQKALPEKGDPYEEIYRVKAEVQPFAETHPTTNTYWGLVDPDLLNPEPENGGDELDELNEDALQKDPWKDYLNLLGAAEQFHDALGKNALDDTFNIRGVNHKTADVIELAIESNWFRDDPYPSRDFRGFFINAEGDDMQAVIQNPAGDGDATVPRSSGGALDKPGKQTPGDVALEVEHQPAFGDENVMAFVVEAIKTLCRKRYRDKRYPLGDFPAQGAGARMG